MNMLNVTELHVLAQKFAICFSTINNISLFTLKKILVIKKYIYLFLVVLGLCCCARAFSSCGEQGFLLIAVHRLFTVVASLVSEHRHVSSVAAKCGLQSAQYSWCSHLLLRSLWNPPRPGVKPVSPALASGFLPTVPTGKS